MAAPSKTVACAQAFGGRRIREIYRPGVGLQRRKRFCRDVPPRTRPDSETLLRDVVRGDVVHAANQRRWGTTNPDSCRKTAWSMQLVSTGSLPPPTRHSQVPGLI